MYQVPSNQEPKLVPKNFEEPRAERLELRKKNREAERIDKNAFRHDPYNSPVIHCRDPKSGVVPRSTVGTIYVEGILSVIPTGFWIRSGR